MNIKLSELVAAEQALAELAQEKVSAKLAFQLGLVLKDAGKYLDEKRDAQRKLFERYKVPRKDNPKKFEVPEETREQYKNELEAMLAVEVSIQLADKLSANALVADGVKISGQDAVLLDWLIKNDLEEASEAK